jgi:hypothetical protein
MTFGSRESHGGLDTMAFAFRRAIAIGDAATLRSAVEKALAAS